MDADDHKVEAVLKEPRRFIVPLYQRKYQWAEHRLLPFWEDVEAKAAEVLSGDSRFEHYMGALILAPVDIGSEIGKTPIVQVVDGQQRLTTFQIFLASLREVARSNEVVEFIPHINGYLFNEPKSKDVDPLTKYKLNPTPSDREIFHDLLHLDYASVCKKHKNLFWGASVPKNTPFPAFRAYYLFNLWISDFVKSGPSDVAPDDGSEETKNNGIVDFAADHDDATSEVKAMRLEALLNAVLERLKLVVITLDEDKDDAQVIFETLNSKGEPLLAMDLVRNNIFHRAEKQGADVEALYEDLWDPLDEPWWRERAPNARPARPRIDHFLAHTLAAETGEKISMRELYAEYRAFASPKGRPRFEDVEKELRLLEHYAPIYETLEGRRSCDDNLAWFGRKMADWKVTTTYPVALQLGSNDVDRRERGVITKLIYSYIVRRAVCGLTSKNLNNVFQGLSAKFLESGAKIDSFRAYFADKAGDSIRFPSNAEFVSGVIDGNAYSIAPKTRLTDILWEFEKASRSKLAEKNEKPPHLWVEHVMPQWWTDEWPFQGDEYFGPSSIEPEATRRHAVIHTLGNLTLLTDGLNISSGNKKFSEKKEKFSRHTGLFLNKWFAQKNSWTEEDIRERGEHLAKLALQIWPSLD